MLQCVTYVPGIKRYLCVRKVIRSLRTSVDYPSPRAKRLGVRWLEAVLLETPPHPTGPTISLRSC